MLISLRVKQRAVIDRIGQVSRTIRMEKNVLVFELQMEHERFLLNYSVHLDYSVFVPEGTEKKIYNSLRCEQHTYLHLIKRNQLLGIPQKTGSLSS